ncbi:MAG: hypothetical protein HRT74_09585 [Flavobacteriales bacterium]|nr:hypothetical protein [Flavobacteriales bacterium]
MNSRIKQFALAFAILAFVNVSFSQEIFSPIKQISEHIGGNDGDLDIIGISDWDNLLSIIINEGGG